MVVDTVADGVLSVAQRIFRESLQAVAGGGAAAFHVLDGPPGAPADLPAVAVSFPVWDARPVALGGFVGEQRLRDGTPLTLTGVRLDATLCLDLWLALPSGQQSGNNSGKGKNTGGGEPQSESRGQVVGHMEALTRQVSTGLMDQKLRLRRSGLLRLQLREIGPIRNAQEMPAWALGPAEGLVRSVTYGLVLETTSTPEEVEGIIREVDVSSKTAATEERFRIR